MAQAARRLEPERASARRVHLSVVPDRRRARSSAAAARSRTRARANTARAAFSTAMCVLVIAAIVGVVRVAIVARAAEMTLSESELSAGIKAQRLETDRLEIDRGSLATPSRIEAIAAETMGMSRPASVRYITLPAAQGESEPRGATAAATQGPRVGDAVKAVVAALADVSAIEAQALLVGGVGATGPR